MLVVFLFGCAYQTQTIQEVQTESVQVSLEIHSGEEKIADKVFIVEKGKTGFDFLKDSIELKFEEYPFGVFITDIEGVKADQTHYWALYINDSYSEKGIDQVILEKDMKIKFVLEEIQS